MGGGQRGVNLIYQILHIGFNLLERLAVEGGHQRQNLHGNHLVAIEFVFLHHGVAHTRIGIEGLFQGLGAHVFSIGKDNQVLDAAGDVYFLSILEAYRRSPDTVLMALYNQTLADVLENQDAKYILGTDASGRAKQVRIKINPEPRRAPAPDQAEVK